MPPRPSVMLEPRKSPVQARSAASVDAILEATIQVLLQVGKEQLTTTKVAMRAGVSVGTLYQYFPNKTALLRGALKRHLAEVTAAVERVCREEHGAAPRQMVTALITAFLQAKMRDPKTSMALYSVGSDVDGMKIAQQMASRSSKAIVQMLESARMPLGTDVRLVASVIQGAMTGVGRGLVESGVPEKRLEALQRELILFCCAYVDALVGRALPPAHPCTPA